MSQWVCKSEHLLHLEGDVYKHRYLRRDLREQKLEELAGRF
jgi:hypothetical protein